MKNSMCRTWSVTQNILQARQDVQFSISEMTTIYSFRKFIVNSSGLHHLFHVPHSQRLTQLICSLHPQHHCTNSQWCCHRSACHGTIRMLCACIRTANTAITIRIPRHITTITIIAIHSSYQQHTWCSNGW